MFSMDSLFAGKTTLLVEDDEVFRQRLRRALEQQGLAIVEAADVPAARSRVAEQQFNFAIIDLRLPGGSGLEIVRAVAESKSEARIVVLTGFGSIASALEALRLGAVDYITKPASVEQICAALASQALLRRAQTRPRESVPSLARVEWEHINRVLSDVGGNVSEAARLLGIHRRSLQRKLSKFPTRR